MNSQPQFSLVLYVDCAEGMKPALDALLGQAPFLASGQLIVAAPEDSPALQTAFAEAAKQLSVTPILLVLPGCTAPQAYNAGLNAATGSWINFSLSSATLSRNTFSVINTAIQNHDTLYAFSLRPLHVGLGADQPYLIAPEAAGDISVDLERQYRYLQLILQAYFFKREILEGKRFSETIHDDALHLFLFQTLMDTAYPGSDLNVPAFRFLSNASYRYTIALEDNMQVNLLQYEKWWYINSIRDFFIPFLRSFSEGGLPVPDFIQHACVWLIGSKYRCNFNDLNKHVLNKEEFETFYLLCSQAMVYLDNRFILQRGFTPQVSLSLDAARLSMLSASPTLMVQRNS